MNEGTLYGTAGLRPSREHAKRRESRTSPVLKTRTLRGSWPVGVCVLCQVLSVLITYESRSIA